jgi:S1-C subfamily serine protease
MIAPRLIRMTETAEFSALRWQGAAVLQHSDALADFLARKGMQDLATLFGAPVLGKPTETGFRQVSWYTHIQGNAVSLSDLHGPDREAAEARLREQMQRLQPLLDDPEAGGLLRRALVIPSLADVSVIFGNAVLVNWGLAPASAMATDDDLARHWAATLGAYAHFAMTTLEPQPHLHPVMKVAPPPVIAPVPGPAFVPTHPALVETIIVQTLPWYQRPGAWAVCGIGMVVAGLLLGLLLRPLFASDPAVARAVAAQKAINDGLEAEVGRLRDLDASHTCPPNGAAVVPLATAPVAPVEGQAAPAQPVTLASQLEGGSAIVLSDEGTGSAFFVAPGVLVTNHHVIEGAKGGRVFVTSKALGRVHRAQVVATTNDKGRDYAILKLEGDLGQSKPLSLASSSEKLDPVVAAGYPGLLITDDPKFHKLLDGDISAAPELVFSEGIISTKLDLTPQVIAHTAVISQGNSGGPLVDRCGRVLGINTMIQMRDHSTHQANLSLVATDLAQYLKQNGVDLQASDGRCSAPTR